MEQAIPGLGYYLAYLPLEEHEHLLRTIDAQPWLSDLTRRVQHYGYRYDYTRRSVGGAASLGPLPSWAASLAHRLRHEGLLMDLPNQLIITEYLPGQGIASHVDCVPCFGDTNASLSLGSGCVMIFTRLRTQDTVPLFVEAGSLLVLRGEARYGWKHGIPARQSDVHAGQRITRARRVSLTWRVVARSGTR